MTNKNNKSLQRIVKAVIQLNDRTKVGFCCIEAQWLSRIKVSCEVAFLESESPLQAKKSSEMQEEGASVSHKFEMDKVY